MSKFLFAALLAALIQQPPQAPNRPMVEVTVTAPVSAAVRAWDTEFVEKGVRSLQDVASPGPVTGVVLAPFTVSAKGKLKVDAATRVCGDAQLGKDTVIALRLMRPLAKPPMELAGKKRTLRVIFTKPDATPADIEKLRASCR